MAIAKLPAYSLTSKLILDKDKKWGVMLTTIQNDLTGPLLSYMGPILSTGMVGIILLMILLRVKIMPTYVYDDAKAEWLRERSDLQSDITELKQTLKDADAVYTQQVIPVLTRVFEAEKELVDLRRAEQFAKVVKPNV